MYATVFLKLIECAIVKFSKQEEVLANGVGVMKAFLF